MVELLDLPVEIVREVLVHAINVRGIKRGVRLRLVNRLFCQEVTQALAETAALEEFIDQGKVREGIRTARFPFWHSYLTQRISHSRRPLEGRLEVVSQMADALCESMPEENISMRRQYVEAMCYRPQRLFPNMTIKWDKKNTPRYLLQAAIINSCIPVVKRILEASDTPRNLLNCSTSAYDLWANPIKLAGQVGNLEILELLFSTKTSIPRDIMREQAMQGAVIGGHFDAVQFIMEPRWGPLNFFSTLAGVESHLLSGVLRSPTADFASRLYTYFEDRSTSSYPLHFGNLDVDELLDDVAACHPQRVDVVTWLLDHGAILQVKRKPLNRKRTSAYATTDMKTQYYEPRQPWNPLRRAVKGGNDQIVKLLLERGADPNATDDDVLLQAVRLGRFDIVKMLVDHGAEVISKPPPLVKLAWVREPEPLIIEAVLMEHERLCQYLLDHGAEIDTPESGGTALRIAVEQGLESMVRFLARHGVKASKDLADKAVQLGNLDMAKVLGLHCE